MLIAITYPEGYLAGPSARSPQRPPRQLQRALSPRPDLQGRSGLDVAHDVLDPGVVVEAVAGQVLAVARVLESAMRHLGDERDMGVDPHRPEVKLASGPHGATVIARPDACREPVLDTVRPAQCLVL